MKNKFLAVIALIPMISNAHTGHVHNATEIMLTPSMWTNHVVIISSIGFLFAVMIWKVLMKYYPAKYKMIKSKLFVRK